MSAQISLGKAWNWETPDYSLFSTNYPLPVKFGILDVQCTTQRLEDRIKQHVPTSIKKQTHINRERPSRGCKNTQRPK